jgi:alkyl sulfatase BDS1-like metallo-beta-lactamase superfamily hydrolase
VTIDQPKQATTHTLMHNRNADNRDFDPADLERVRKGFIAKRENGLITDEKGRFVVNSDNYEFLRDGRDCPETVNPQLWRHATLNAHHGLFKVADGVWQVRGN